MCDTVLDAVDTNEGYERMVTMDLPFPAPCTLVCKRYKKK